MAGLLDHVGLHATWELAFPDGQDWGKLIGDVPAASAILDRFQHHAEVIEITGKSYRDPLGEKQKPKANPKKRGRQHDSEGAPE